MDSQLTSLMHIPKPAILDHLLRNQIAIINALRGTLVILRDNGQHDQRAAMIFNTLIQQQNESIDTVFIDYLSGNGHVATTLRAMLPKDEADARISAGLPTLNADTSPNLDGEWTSKIRVMMGADFGGVWNLNELDRLRVEGKIPAARELPLTDTGLFFVDTGDKRPGTEDDDITYGLRVIVDNGNRTALTLMSGEPFISVATYVPLEDIWAMHHDGRLTDISQIEAILDTYFASIGLTEPLPAAQVEAALGDALAGLEDEAPVDDVSDTAETESPDQAEQPTDDADRDAT